MEIESNISFFWGHQKSKHGVDKSCLSQWYESGFEENSIYFKTAEHYMMYEAEKRLTKLACPKINLQVRASNQTALKFYQTLGFKHDEVISLGKRLEND